MHLNYFLMLGVREKGFDRDVFILSFMFSCIALIAQLTNGTFVSMRGCFPTAAGNCSTSACDQRNGTLSGPEYFARCVVECCSEDRCNNNLFPMLPELQSTVKGVVVSSTAGPTQPETTQATTTGPTSVGIKMKAFLYLPFFLLVILDIMS